MSVWTKGVIVTVLVAIIFPLSSRFCWIQPGPVVETLSGKVRGIVAQSREGRTYHEFLGIPYGQAPTGQLRFEDPLPVAKWDGVHDADRFGPECLQLEILVLGRVIGNEDCLYVNIYAPEIENSGKLAAVMVYLHGGLFMGGSSNIYQGKYLVDEGVMLVTLNYRVAALGFLTSGDGVLRGNQGLKDQILALKWIKENIKNFGGDPNKITLFGESAGGASSHYQMLSPLIKGQGLFHKVMSMSGTAVRLYVSTKDQSGQFKQFGQQFGCSADKSEDILACLKKVDGNLLVEAHRDASDAIPKNRNALFVPTIEVVKDSKACLVEEPRKSLQEGNFEQVPWAAGVVAYEGLLYVARIVRSPEAVKEVNQDWKNVLPKLLKYDAKKVEMTEKIKDFYFGKGSELDVLGNIESMANLLSDRLFTHPTFEAARLQSRFSPVYLYYLSYAPQTSVYDLITSITPDGRIPPPLEFTFSLVKRWIQKKLLGMDVPYYGPSHGDELSLLFNLHFLTAVSKGSVDYEFSRSLVKLWASFAKDENYMEFNGARWLPINHNDRTFKYLELNVNGTFVQDPESQDFIKRLQFWTHLNLPYELTIS